LINVRCARSIWWYLGIDIFSKKDEKQNVPKTTPIKPKKGEEVQDPNYVLIGELCEGSIHVYTYRVIDDSTGNDIAYSI